MNVTKLCANTIKVVSETPYERETKINSIMKNIREQTDLNRFILKNLMTDIKETLKACGNKEIQAFGDDEYKIWVSNMVLTLKEKDGNLILVKLEDLENIFSNNTEFRMRITKSD